MSKLRRNRRKPSGEYDLLTPDGANAVLPDPTRSAEPRLAGGDTRAVFSNRREYTERLAVSDALGSWTYGELERASNRLANDLIANGIEPKDRVAVYAHRDATLVVALTGSAQSGRRVYHSRSGLSRRAVDILPAHRAAEGMDSAARRRRARWGNSELSRNSRRFIVAGYAATERRDFSTSCEILLQTRPLSRSTPMIPLTSPLPRARLESRKAC